MIRISGENALTFARGLFHSTFDISNNIPPAQKVLFGEIRDPESNRVIDEVLFTWFNKPNSYTGENVVEISGHGGTQVGLVLIDLGFVDDFGTRELVLESDDLLFNEHLTFFGRMVFSIFFKVS